MAGKPLTYMAGCKAANAAQGSMQPTTSPTYLQVVEQRRRLPPVLNDRALFTKAAPYGDRGDQTYHAPSNRIGVNYSPDSRAAASILFEEFPQASSTLGYL